MTGYSESGRAGFRDQTVQGCPKAPPGCLRPLRKDFPVGVSPPVSKLPEMGRPACKERNRAADMPHLTGNPAVPAVRQSRPAERSYRKAPLQMHPAWSPLFPAVPPGAKVHAPAPSRSMWCRTGSKPSRLLSTESASSFHPPDFPNMTRFVRPFQQNRLPERTCVCKPPIVRLTEQFLKTSRVDRSHH